MKVMNLDNPRIPLNLQFFASNSDNGEGGESNSTGESGDQNSDNSTGSNDGTDNNSGTKTFTQDEVSAISTREKNQGKNAILKIFGCANEKEAKEQAQAFKNWQESQKTDEQKKNEAEQQLKDSAAESEKRATAAENKLTVITAGVPSDSVDDVLAIALPKVTEEKPLDKVLEEMKKNARYAAFFENKVSQGTGTGARHSKPSGTESTAARLAKNNAASKTQKSNFFKTN